MKKHSESARGTTPLETESTNIADLICHHLYFYGEREGAQELNKITVSLGLDFHTVMATIISEALLREFMVFPRALPGLPLVGKPAVTSRFRSYGGADDGDPKIFFSYRRNDCHHWAGRIHDKLTATFGEAVIFKDLNSMPLGTPFREELKRIIPRCKVMLLVMGSDWLGKERHGKKPRIFDLLDPVRLEIEVALSSKVPIVCALVGGARPPKPSDIPKSIAGLLSAKCISIGAGLDFGDDFNELITACLDAAGTGHGLNGVAIPDLDSDTVLSVRILASIALHFDALLQRYGNQGKQRLILELMKDSSALLAMETALSAWTSYFGRNENAQIVSSFPSVADIIGRITKTCYSGFSDGDWKRMEKRLRGISEPTGSVSKAQMVAMAAAQSLADEFFIVRKGEKPSRPGENPLEIIKSVGANFTRRENLRTYVSYLDADRSGVIERMTARLSEAMGDNVIIASRPTLNSRAHQIMGGCATYLLVLEPRVLSVTPESPAGKRLRREIGLAMKKGLKIIPVLLPGMESPRDEDFPETLLPIMGFSHFQLRNDPDFSNDVDQLILFCRTCSMAKSASASLTLPRNIPYHSLPAIKGLYSCASFLKNLIAELASGSIEKEEIEEKYTIQMKMSRLTLSLWGPYFGLGKQ